MSQQQCEFGIVGRAGETFRLRDKRAYARVAIIRAWLHIVVGQPV